MRLTRYGRKEWITATGVALVLLAVAVGFRSVPLAGLVVPAWLAAVAFFRDPRRKVPADPGTLLAPADGVVDNIEQVTGTPECELLETAEAWRIGIFLSVFNVHINRAPCHLTVTTAAHREGGYGNAMNVRAEEVNESQTLVCKTGADTGGLPLVVRQISGAVARRIVCEALPGTVLRRGQTYGMIKYGSRTQIFVPATPGVELVARKGMRARAGETVLARVEPDDAKPSS